MMFDEVIDFSNPRERSLIMGRLRELVGLHRLTVKAHRRTRTNPQNRYYWSCYVQPLVEFLADQGEMKTKEEVHQMFAMMFLRESIVDPSTGEVLGETVRSTTKLNTTEFNEYLERVAQWLAEKVGIVVVEPEQWGREAA